MKLNLIFILLFPEDEILFGGLPGTSTDLGLPPRPPSVRSKDKSVRSTTPNSEKDVLSPTPSSGHYSAGSTSFLSKSPGDKTESVIPRLRSEIDHLKKRFSQSERDWAEVNKYICLICFDFEINFRRGIAYLAS